MKYLIVLVAMILAVTVTGCAAALPRQAEQEPADSSPSDPAHGELKEGTRVIVLDDDIGNISVFRGETVRLILRAEGVISLSAPNFEAFSEGSDEVWIEIKAADIGAFDIAATIKGEEKNGKLTVEAYVQQGVYYSVNASDFEAAMTGEYILLDVRTLEEYDRGHIEGALLIPHSQLEDRLDELEGYDKILVYCASGNRSVAASQILIEAGFGEVYDLAGGYSAWQSYKN